jgi:hypothetical protein
MTDNSDDPTLPEAMIDETLNQTFPASDPPAWTLGRESESPVTEQPPIKEVSGLDRQKESSEVRSGNLSEDQ